MASKPDLFVYNYLCGIKYSRRWTRIKLITNLYKIENIDYNIIIEQLNKSPDIYTMTDLYERIRSNDPLPFINSKEYSQ